MTSMLTRTAAVLLAACTLAACTARAPLTENRSQPPRSTSSFGAPVASPLLTTSETVTGEALAWPKSPLPWLVSQIVTIGPGQSTGWHRHEVPTYGHLLSGVLEIEYAGLGRRTLRAGDTLLESMKEAHNAVNLGSEPVRILVVFMGASGRQTVVKTDPPSMPAALGMPAGPGGSRQPDLVDIGSVDPRIRIDLRYAGDDNFTGRRIYDSARALMQRPAAEALRRVNERALAKGYALLVLDAYRPWSVTRLFWDEFPMHRAYLADPLAGSRHNRGCAVDLTLVDLRSDAEVAMPSAYDDFSERAHPAWTGGTSEQRAMRELLRGLMETEGFTIYENEWWHFDFRDWQSWPVMDVDFGSAVPAAVSAR